MENDNFDGELNDQDLVLEFIQFSTLPVLLLIEDIQKDIDFHRRAVEVNGMALARDVFVVCDTEVNLDATKYH